MDRVETQLSPAAEHAGEGTTAAREVTEYRYDDEDALERRIGARAATVATAGAFTERYVRDEIGRVTAAVRQSRTGDPAKDKDHVTSTRTTAATTSSAWSIARQRAPGRRPVGEREGPGEAAVHVRVRRRGQPAEADGEPGRARDGVRVRRQRQPDERGRPAGQRVRREPRRLPHDPPLRRARSPHPRRAAAAHRRTRPTTEYKLRADGKVDQIVRPNGYATTGTGDAAGDHATAFAYFATGELKSRSIPFAIGQYGARDWQVRYDRDPVGDPTRITARDARERTIDSTFYETGDLRTTNRPGWWGFEPSSADRRPVGGGEIVETGRPGGGAAADSGNDLPSSEAKNDFGEVTPKALPSIVPRAGATTFGYDGEMRLTSVDNGAEKQLVRDALGRVASVSYPYDGATRIVERYAYDRHGNLATVTDGAGEVRTTVFDQFDRAVEQHEPGTDKGIETTVTTYDENDNTVLVRTPRGTETEMHYDALDRMDWRENGADERRSSATTSPATR